VGTENHPVWIVYDDLRTARLNVKYYECQLQKLQRVNTAMELCLAFTAPSSAFAGFAFWKYEIGQVVWSLLGSISAIVALCKPILALTKKIRDMESVVQGYRLLYFELKEIRSAIEQEKRFGPTLKLQLKKCSQREKELVSRNPESKPNKKLRRTCMDEVMRELPLDSFYIPPEAE